ncbi:MAG: transcription factor S [Nanoarchaeota archaeon]
MMFCPKCGAILVPKKEGDKRVLHCSCGHTNRKPESIQMTEAVEQGKKLEIIEREDTDSLPITSAECPKCKNENAHFWEVQTRAADEPATKFLKCTKCKHTWRDYS